MSDCSDSLIEESGQENPSSNNSLETQSRVVDIALAPMSFPAVMSHFSDIVSKTSEPFGERLSKLLSLSAHYLQTSVAVYGEIEGSSFTVNVEFPDTGYVHSSFSRSLPILQALLTAQQPLDTHLVNDDRFFACPGNRCLVAPVRIDGEIRAGLLLVCQSVSTEKEAQEQLLFVKMLARYIGNEAMRREAKAALTYRIEFEQLLSDISRSFIHVKKDEIDDAIREALRRIAGFALVDSSYIMMFSQEQAVIEITHWWRANKKISNFPHGRAATKRFPWSLGKILAGEVIVISDIAQLPQEAEPARKLMISQGMKTAILTPLIFRGSVKGLVGFASAEQRSLVDGDKMQLLQMVGHTLSSAVELKHAQECVEVLEEQVRHTQKLESLGVLAGGIAHDFNNLLMGVLGNAGIALQDNKVEGDTRVAIERVERIACHAGELTNQLLAYSGRGKFVVEIVNLSDIASNMRELLSTVVSKRHALSVNFAHDLPVVEVDVAQISQVVMNLITNASEAIGEENGDITLSSGLLSVNKNSLYENYYSNDTADGVYVFLRVSDTGCGMDEETRSKIFDPFYSTKFTGRGLGLAAVLGIVRGHGGTIRVDSTVGRGTTFTVLLPCASTQEIITSASEKIVKSKSLDPLKVLQGKCVLVVDDEESIRQVMDSVLKRQGCQVLLAASGTEALEIFEKDGERIDICLIDMTMPDMSGYEVSQNFRQQRRTLPIILTSGYSEQEVRKHCELLQDTIFLQKPFHPQRLLEHLAELV